MKILFSGYDAETRELMLRVCAEVLPEAEKRQLHRAAHFAALDLLGAVLAEDFGVYHAVIHRSGLGKPKLLHDSLYMNLSHCKGLAVAAVGRMPLGVDAEAPRRVKDSLMQKVCTPEEYAAIMEADDKSRAFTKFWTLKEAYAKYTGEGIALDFSALGFSVLQDGTIRFDRPEADHVQLVQIPLREYTVSLCYEYNTSNMKMMQEVFLC
ncbi:MAG: 4'-phosphopantetheinyl transferase superfamily protein [Oscillospiraceae bacterium]|nr:4'-phosphopantetheinyl transferase superfamily protein [Oscillospiraceae bacterium]